ncbi:DUF397 domain-containing protein [Nocardiopsis alborubida]|uniref:DUF397 domain-containing protein n=1 Tax=Nocardiopsis alborubida TaxID=146802 RepID=A0A7X6RN44_9ACTN|nr:DUF397 domain-containing protein [Nocardiopsis alborubida]NKY96385.1 DUF397 domain-containing protein [Nocardiopsis alborubida]
MTWRKSSYSTHSGDCVELSNWHKSSYSTNGGECVEVSDWHKSSHSSGVNNDCVEVAEGWTETLVRDTQNRELGHLAFTAPEWTSLLSTLKARQR